MIRYQSNTCEKKEWISSFHGNKAWVNIDRSYMFDKW